MNNPSQPNRALVVVLIGVIVAVLGLLVWLLAGRGGAPAEGEPAADLATALGAFYQPGEFEPQDILYLAGDQLAARHPAVLTAVVRAAAPRIRLVILCGTAPGRARVDSLLTADRLAGLPLTVQAAPLQTLWLRDCGPFTVTDPRGRRSLVEFSIGEGRRAGWRDDGLPPHLAELLGLTLLGSPLPVEGGDVLTDGRGFGLLSLRLGEEAAPAVAAMLGFEHILMVAPLLGEETGHIDRCCTFLAADQVVVGRLDPGSDPENARRLDRLAADLDGLKTLGGPLRVARIDQPAGRDGLGRSYTSVVLANEVVLVPTYPDCCGELDRKALDLYARLLPGRQVVGIDASGLARAGATLRDVTAGVAVGGPLAAPVP